jgi:hypothetical protein
MDRAFSPAQALPSSEAEKEENLAFSVKYGEIRVFLLLLMFASHKAGKLADQTEWSSAFKYFRITHSKSRHERFTTALRFCLNQRKAILGSHSSNRQIPQIDKPLKSSLLS